MTGDASADEFQALRVASAAIGADPLLIQGPGGNTSVKRGDVLTIKASGTWLRDALDQPIFVDLDLPGVLGNQSDDDAPFVLGGAALRPSIETPVHAVVPHAAVIHVHHVETIAFAVCEDAAERLRAPLEGLSWRFVPYVKPGRPLARAMWEAAGGDRIDVTVLGNHGLVVAGDTVDEAMALLADVRRRLALRPRAAPGPDLARLAGLSDGTAYAPADDPAVHALGTDERMQRAAAGNSFYPDHVVFLGPGLMVLQEGESLAGCLARVGPSVNGAPPALIAVPGAGALLARSASPGARAMARCLADVLSRVPEGAALRPLPPEAVAALVTWDAEAYRRSMEGTR